MFKNNESVVDEVVLAMEKSLIETAYNENNKIEQKLLEAAEYLSTAAKAFEQAGMHKYAEAATVLTETVIKRGECGGLSKKERTKVWAHYGGISENNHADEDAAQEGLEERFLDMILGEDQPPEDKPKTEQIVEENEADDLNMIDELFEDV